MTKPPKTPKPRRGRPANDPSWDGSRMRRAMAARGMSARELARRMGVQPSTITRWMKGERTPPRETAARIAQILRARVRDGR